MGETSAVQTAFLGGEWSLAAQGRMDDQRYRTALNVCFNGLPIESGAWVRRPGSLYAGQTWLNKPARVYPFNFADFADYTLELTDLVLRFRQGATIIRTNDDVTVASISGATPAVVTTSSAHGWSGTVGVVFPNAAGLPTLQNREFQGTITGSTTLTLSDLSGNPVSGAGLGSLPAGLTIGRLQTLTTPFAAGGANGDWNNLRVVQADTVNAQGALQLNAVMLTGTPPQSMVCTALPTSNQNGGFAQFSALSAISFQDGPYLDIPTDGTLLTPSAKSGSITITLSGGGAGTTTKFVSTDVGRLVRIQSIPPVWNSSSTYSNGNLVYYAGNVYEWLNPSGGTASGSPPVNQPSQYFPGASPAGFYGWQLQPASFLWSWGTITAVGSTISATLTIDGPALLYTSATPYFRLGAYSNTTGWPTCGTFHEGRLWLAGAIPNRVDGSMTAVPTPDASFGAQVGATSPNIYCFCPTDIYGNVTDANGVDASLLSPNSDQIFWMEPDQQGIICGTKNGEWLIQATSANLPLTPTSIQAHRYTKIGCANIEPRRCGLTLAFIQFFGRKVMEYFSDVFSGRLTGPNLSEMAKHLTVNFVKELAYQRETAPIIWARDGAGNLLSCSYKRESLFSREKPTFAGWARHTLGSGRTVTSIAMGSNTAGTLDALAMVTTDGSTYWVEVLSDIPDENTVNGLQYVDAGVPISYTLGASSITITGLWHLNGHTVTIWVAGLDVGDYAVANGQVTVTYGDGINSGPNGYSSTTGTQNPGGGAYLLTEAYVNAATGTPLIAVGFTYASQGQVVRPASPQESGARAGPAFGKNRRSHRYAALLANSQGISFGTTFANLMPALLKDAGENLLAPNTLFSGVQWDQLHDDYSRDGMLAWQIGRPYPATLAAAGWFIETADE